MSNLIMPGSEEFKRTAKVLDFKLAPKLVPAVGSDPAPSPAAKDIDPADLESLRGRTLTLGAGTPKFQCGGFTLGPGRPFAVVGPEAQLEPIRRALAEGKLADITGQDLKQGFMARGGAVSRVEAKNVGQEARVIVNKQGELLCVAFPKNKAEARKIDRQIQKGVITITDRDEMSGMSGVVVENLPPEPPTEGKTSGRTPRRKRKPRQ